MNCRFLNTLLHSVVYRTGKRKFVTTSMSSIPKSKEAPNYKLDIPENSADPHHQENFSDHSFSSGSVSFETPQREENLIDGAVNSSAAGPQLSKRALKRVQ